MTAFRGKAGFVKGLAGKPTQHLLTVSIREQALRLWERELTCEVGRLALRGVAIPNITYAPHTPLSPNPTRREGAQRPGEGCFQVLQTAFPISLQTTVVAGRRYRQVRKFRCSTSRFGIGQQAGSNCTPLGWHRIARKIGGGWPVGTVFKSRQPVGFTWKGMPLASITTRILWLEGLEPGFNQGGDVDTFRRYIYIHGTGDEPTLGRPASHGCIHLAADDLIPLYEQLPAGTPVWIGR